MHSFVRTCVSWLAVTAYMALLGAIARWLTDEPQAGRIRAWSRAAAGAATAALAAACAGCWWAFVTHRHDDASLVAPAAFFALSLFADALIFVRAARADYRPGFLRFPRRAPRADGPA